MAFKVLTLDVFDGNLTEQWTKKNWDFTALVPRFPLCTIGVGFHGAGCYCSPKSRYNVLTPRVITLATIVPACPVIRDTQFYPRSCRISRCVPFQMNTCLYTSNCSWNVRSNIVSRIRSCYRVRSLVKRVLTGGERATRQRGLNGIENTMLDVEV